MDEKQAKRLGAEIRRSREAAGWSLRQLEERTGIDNSLLARMEQGLIFKPAPDNLRRIAEALGIPLADLYALADWAVPSELPSPGPYLRAKYRDLSESTLRSLTEDVNRLLAQHGLDLSGAPAPGEDEAPEPSRSPKPRPPRTRTKKGGKR